MNIQRAARNMKRKALVKYLSKSYLGFKLTTGQLEGAAKTLLAMRTDKYINVTPGLFWWEANKLNTPKE